MSARSQVESGFEFLARRVVRWRWPAIAVLVALTISLGSLVPQVRTDNSQESFLKKGDPARAGYDQFKEQFGADEQISVLFAPEQVFEPGFFELLRKIHEEIEREAPYVSEVMSLINARNTRGIGDSLVVQDLTHEWPESPADFAALRAPGLRKPPLHQHAHFRE